MKTGFARVRSRVDAIDGIRVKNWHIFQLALKSFLQQFVLRLLTKFA